MIKQSLVISQFADICKIQLLYTFLPSPMIKQLMVITYSNQILICMLGTAAAAWTNLQGKSCTGILNILNLILLYTFSQSLMIKQSMVISCFLQISAN
jgi:hypothetical protein